MKNLTSEEDAYGQEIWAHYNGFCSPEIVERDDGYFSLSTGGKLYFSSCEEWAFSETKAIEYVKGRVLDVGCGAGRHSLYLQEKGYDILGIDVSPLAIKICELRGLKKVEVMSIEEVKYNSNSFDTIIMLGNNFGLFGSFDNARMLLKRFSRITSRDALIIAGTRDSYKTDDRDHLEYQELNRRRGRMSGQLRIKIRYRKYSTPWFDYLLASKEEMKEIIKGTGWKAREFIDSEGSSYIVVMEKENAT